MDEYDNGALNRPGTAERQGVRYTAARLEAVTCAAEARQHIRLERNGWLLPNSGDVLDALRTEHVEQIVGLHEKLVAS
ncbi:MAG: hypothetical protein R6W76_07405 [Caldilinea sp.]